MGNAETERLQQSQAHQAHWKHWGPYLSERAWGTVREDYSPDGEAWRYFPYSQAHLKAYRWNEDGLAGICDRHQLICFAVSLWNGQDATLKERLFGLNGEEGNHGEDVKECYFYLDSTPTHSYMKYLYKYPQQAFPYEKLISENAARTRHDPEYELVDTDIFDENRYFDVFVEYAKAAPEDILIQIEVVNWGPDPAPIDVLPTTWFRNIWSWQADSPRPSLKAIPSPNQNSVAIQLDHPDWTPRWLYCNNSPALLFTENETNTQTLYGTPNQTPYVKDSIQNAIVHGDAEAVNPAQQGTKSAAHYHWTVQSGQRVSMQLRLSDNPLNQPFDDFDTVFAQRRKEADIFYGDLNLGTSPDEALWARQAFAGLMWSKQFYHYIIKDWLSGDPAMPPPPAERLLGRNHGWTHLYNADVISMPDKWEYPWYAAWDLSFHCVAIAQIDIDFAKEQLILMLREWYMHPSGKLPAYEWNFDDANPPVHAWAALTIYKLEQDQTGHGDRNFLERIFHKLMLNFTWWVNRKDLDQQNVFQGGFLGLDNIAVFDRSKPLPMGGHLEQSDGTSWMAMYSLDLLAIALELAKDNMAYEDVASKFWEHFIYIAHAVNHIGPDAISMWNAEDSFFYDILSLPTRQDMPLKVRSMVGLIPLLAVEILEPDLLDKLTSFKHRLEWFVDNRPDLTGNVACMETEGHQQRRLLSIMTTDQLRAVLKVMLDENEFLSPHGIRSLSRYHQAHPFKLTENGVDYTVDYEPAESTTNLFGGNSNWRGPVWMPLNVLMIEALRKYYDYLGKTFTVECPTGSGQQMTLAEVADFLSHRLIGLFNADASGQRPVFNQQSLYQTPGWQNLLQFYEYFHGDTGAGLGANHQTGWTSLVVSLLYDLKKSNTLF